MSTFANSEEPDEMPHYAALSKRWAKTMAALLAKLNPIFMIDRIMRHFIRVRTVCKDNSNLHDKNALLNLKFLPVSP